MDNDLEEKFAQRFEDEQNDHTQKNEESDESDESEQSVGSAWNVENVKQDWTGNTVYLPDPLDEAFDDEFRRLNYESGGELKKDRHYKPLVVHLGLERIAEMDGNEVLSLMERMEGRE